MNSTTTTTLAIVVALCIGASTSTAQPPFGERPPQFDSFEASAERELTFRIHAPNADAVRLVSSDLPGMGRGAEMEKGDNGVWKATVGPVPAGAYRYNFNVDGLSVIDPRNPATSEANMNTWSLAYVPGSDRFDTKNVPHGAVAEVAYYSNTLNRHRRMHVYTPPGYEKGGAAYPVFYLLHGATDSDDSWSSVGRAGLIVDNLIAAGQAKPMIVVMPQGHTGPFAFGIDGGSFERQMEEFQEDFVSDIRPYIESHYRAKTDRASRAIAGLSMGGAQTLNAAAANLSDYAYVGVYSSGVFGIAGGFGGEAPSTEWEERHAAALDDAQAKNGLQLVWFATGKGDFLVGTSKATVDMLTKHGFDVTYVESEGGHTWLNWRDYLHQFVPMLFGEH